VKRPAEAELSQYKLVEILLMKQTRYGKTYSGETINRVLPRYEYFNQSMTLIDVKRYIY
jgi:hypothetical protein